MLVKLENAQIKVDRDFLLRHFEYVQRRAVSSLAHSDEVLDLNLFRREAFVHLTDLLENGLEPLNQDALVEMTRLASFLHTDNYADKVASYLTQHYGYEPLRRNNLRNMTFLYSLTRLLTPDYPELSGEKYGFLFFREISGSTGGSPEVVDFLIPVGI